MCGSGGANAALKGPDEEERRTFDASVRAEIPHQLSGGGREKGRRRWKEDDEEERWVGVVVGVGRTPLICV